MAVAAADNDDDCRLRLRVTGPPSIIGAAILATGDASTCPAGSNSARAALLCALVCVGEGGNRPVSQPID